MRPCPLQGWKESSSSICTARRRRGKELNIEKECVARPRQSHKGQSFRPHTLLGPPSGAAAAAAAAAGAARATA